MSSGIDILDLTKFCVNWSCAGFEMGVSLNRIFMLLFHLWATPEQGETRKSLETPDHFCVAVSKTSNFNFKMNLISPILQKVLVWEGENLIEITYK